MTTTLEGKALEWMQGFKVSKERKSLPFIGFEDGETKTLQFFPDKKPQPQEMTFKGQQAPRTMWKFEVVDLTLAGTGEYDDTIKEWPVGPRLADEIVQDHLSKGESILEITRKGKKGSTDTKYWIKAAQVRQGDGPKEPS